VESDIYGGRERDIRGEEERKGEREISKKVGRGI
jgi:hypothetical protein